MVVVQPILPELLRQVLLVQLEKQQLSLILQLRRLSTITVKITVGWEEQLILLLAISPVKLNSRKLTNIF